MKCPETFIQNKEVKIFHSNRVSRMKLVYKFVWSSGREKEAAYRGIFVKQESPCFKQNSFLYKKSAMIIATPH
jgi:hypothetical protein